ncbi:hypothetical protein MKW98_026695 [Papaver atlanticum]|uniref:DUF3444 domain-containing protein n=1 Tax=Papaver atlanticum TaxID=357466 RepID=A0AAD4X5L7_9MAGN|nr:hypothetical protein MKW98_026695 [Papaver atlanticum]
MNVITQIKIEKDLQMLSPGFTPKGYQRKGLANTESEPLTDKGKEDASLSMEDKMSDSSNSDAEEVAAEDEDNYDLDVKPVAEEVAVSDLYDFYWDKSEECFAVDQIWAIYYYAEGMPKRFARINEVYSPFKVDVTWLEYVAGDMDETAWKRSGLPVACGKFKLGKTIAIDDIRAFSHKIFWKISVDRSCNIYPQKGETWALYKNWDIKWSSDPDNHREYEYEFVEVLSDYTYIRGISVSHLVKLKGFNER